MIGLSTHVRGIYALRNYGLFLKDDMQLQTDPYVLTCRNGLNFKLRSRRHARISDIDIFSEVILNDEYNLRNLLKPDSKVVDIGAHIGFFSCYAAYHARAGAVYSAEPHPDNYQLLSDNIRRNALENITAMNTAISCDSEPVEISQESWNTGAHSMYGAGKEKKTVSATTLETLVSMIPGKIDLMKIDCEGAEYPILLNSPAEAVTKARRIIFEQHMTENTLKLFRKDSILSRLTALGYKTAILKTMHYPGEGEFWLVQADLS